MFGWIKKKLLYKGVDMAVNEAVKRTPTSWRTTLLGLGGTLAILGQVVQALFDSDPATVVDWNITIPALAASLGLLFARDQKAHDLDAPKDPSKRSGALTGVFILALMLGASQARAQTDFVPQYFTLGGVSYDYYGGSGFAGVTVFGAKLTPTSEGKPGFPVYSITTIELTKDIATARTGLSYVFFQDGNWALAGLGDAGATTGSGQTLGSFSGGGSISFDIGGKLTGNKSHFFISPAVRVLNITGKTVQPIYEIMFGPGFGR